jgi:hypothetical protein
MLPDVLQQAIRRIFHHIQHALKAFHPTIVRIGHFVLAVALGEFKEQAKMALRIARTQTIQRNQVEIVHCQHVIEAKEILRFYLPSAQVAHVITALLRCTLRARSGR